MSDVLLIQPLIDENLVYNKSDKKDSESYKEKVRQIRIPQGLLSIGSYLNSLNYDVEIFDCRLHYENGKLTLLEDLRKKIKDSKILIGISVMTPYVAQTVEIINLIKKENPNIPIVLGGIHPTLFPEQTCEDKDVDFVIIGDGEYPMAELVKALDEKKLVKGIKSLVYKKIKAIKINQLGKPYNIQESPIPAYHLLEIEKYLPSIPFYSETEQIGLDYTFTRGCPFNCSFCSNKVLQQNRVYRYKSSNKVVEELSILKRKYKFSYIYLEDDNPLVNIKNFLETAKQFMKRDLNISYLAGCRVDTIVGASFEDLKIMRDSGWRETIIGAESGSNKILNYLNKGINVEQTLQAAKILNKLGVWSAYNVMDCIPNETFRERRQTYDLMRKLKQIHPQSILVGPHHFRPFPGSELYQTCLKEKMIEPKTFRDWSNCDLFYTTSPSDLPWVKDYHKSEKIEMIFRVYGVGGLIARGLKSAFFHIRRRI